MTISEIEVLHERLVRRVRRLPDYETWDGTASEAIPLLVKKLGGNGHLAKIIAKKKGYTKEQHRKLEQRINNSKYGLRDPEILQEILEVWETLDSKPSRKKEKPPLKRPKTDIKTSEFLGAYVRRMDQFRDWNGSSYEACVLLKKFVGQGMGLAHILKKAELIVNEVHFARCFHNSFFCKRLPAPKILSLACVGWKSLLDEGKYNLDPDLPYEKANDLVGKIKGYENWSREKKLKEAFAVLAKELGGAGILVFVLQQSKNYSEEEAKKFRNAITNFMYFDYMLSKTKTDLALELWKLILENPEAKRQIRTGYVDQHKACPEATTLVRRKLRKSDWNGTLSNAFPILKKLGGGGTIAKMLGLLNDQEQRIKNFLSDPVRAPRAQDLQCALIVWEKILDRIDAGLKGEELTAFIATDDPVRRQSVNNIGSSLNDVASGSQHSAPIQGVHQSLKANF